ncbi:MAG TPA: hypothetical protein VFP32_01225, partial [Candidatus Saccharimonadales bacterium]|nr:hypothetical protein [Candidatus Saccharimonadales bacterium]
MDIETGESMGERPKLLPSVFQDQAELYLRGTVLLQVLSSIDLQTDSDGNLQPRIVDNMRMMLKVASEKTP